MKEASWTSRVRPLRPYLWISLIGILAFAPVSFMLRSLKNDVVALEYPINHFMSQCIRNGEIPYWFNTWALGFPLQSNLTWGIFSTPQMLFSSIFKYDIYTLHLEFVLFVLLAGWGMYYLLKQFFLKDEKLAFLLSCCYMLSGFVAGAGQWMLYVTANAFIPLVLVALLQLLKQPGFRNAILFAVLYFFMFTSVYAGLNIISTYCLILFTSIYVWRQRKSWKENNRTWKWLGIGISLAILFCLPCLYYTVEVLQNISRGDPITGKESFFNSNYVPIEGLNTVLFPFSSVRMNYLNTEGTMYDSYMGIFVLMLIPLAIKLAWKEKNRLAMGLLIASIVFLLIATGNQLPLRKLLNVLPGFSYFRNPGMFRLYFIFFLILFLAAAFRNLNLRDVFKDKVSNPWIRYILLVFASLAIFIIVLNLPAFRQISFTSIGDTIRQLDHKGAILISALLQLGLILFYFLATGKYSLLKWVVAIDLVANMLICSPYFIVSDYSPKQVMEFLKEEKGFPIQSGKVNEIPAVYVDDRGNTWNNTNTFRKEVSSRDSYRGPLELKRFAMFQKDSADAVLFFDQPLMGMTDSGELKVILQKPTRIDADIQTNRSLYLSCMQNYFPGWNVYYNNQKQEIFVPERHPGIAVNVEAGKGTLSFRYEKKIAWISALALHIFCVVFLLWYLSSIRSTKYGLRSTNRSKD